MFKNLFKNNKCPIDSEEKEWIESNILWLCKEFGYQNLLFQNIPTQKTKELQDAIKYSDFGSLDFIVNYTCQHMDIDPNTIHVEIYKEQGNMEIAPGLSIHNPKGAAGLYDGNHGNRILLEESELRDPYSLIATLAHELGHVRLLGEGRITVEEEEDHELLTDLTAAFFGFGVLCSNSVFKLNKHSHGWESSRKGYMSVPMYAYTLALIALCRNETKPEWRDSLSTNGKVWFDQSLRFIKDNKETPFYPFLKSFDSSFVPKSLGVIQDRLKLASAIEDYDYAASLKEYLQTENEFK